MAGSAASLLPPPQVSSIQLSIHTSSCSLLFPGQKREQILPYPEYLWCLSSTPTFPRHHNWHLIATECQLPWTLASLQGSVWMQPCYSLWVYVVWGMEIFAVDYWNSATRMVRTSEHRRYGNEQSLAVFALFIPRSGSAYPSRQAEMMSVCRLLPLQVDCWSAATYPGIHVDEKYQRMPFFHICICTFIHRHSEISLYLKKNVHKVAKAWYICIMPLVIFSLFVRIWHFSCSDYYLNKNYEFFSFLGGRGGKERGGRGTVLLK